MHGVAWKLVGTTITDVCPTWCNANQSKRLATSSASTWYWIVSQYGGNMIWIFSLQDVGHQPHDFWTSIQYVLYYTSATFFQSSCHQALMRPTPAASWKLDSSRGFRNAWQLSMVEWDDQRTNPSWASSTSPPKGSCQRIGSTLPSCSSLLFLRRTQNLSWQWFACPTERVMRDQPSSPKLGCYKIKFKRKSNIIIEFVFKMYNVELMNGNNERALLRIIVFFSLFMLRSEIKPEDSDDDGGVVTANDTGHCSW